MRGYKRYICALAVLVTVPASSEGSAQDTAKSSRNIVECRKAKDPDAGIRACTAVLQELLDSGNDTGVSMFYFFRIQWYLKTEQYEKALADYDAQRKVGADPESVHVGKAQVYVAMKRHDLAIAEHTAAISFRASAYHPYLFRARSYIALKDYRNAIADLTHLIQAFPKPSSEVFRARATAYEALNEKDKAIADYRSALSADPADEASKAGLKRLGVNP